MKTRFLLTVTLCVVVCALTIPPRNAPAAELGIGSKAPALDIEHWVQDGNGFFKPVTEFSSGKVYVVEFWATWCGPCIASMPHLAELQTKYRGRGVQIVSISDESLDEVKALLLRENEEAGKTFEEITSAYSLTTDPDRSNHVAYMEAANQSGIPTSFIVGKSGLIEWIGHPMEMDAPLEAVVTDSWDREAFKAEMKEQQMFQENIQRISMLAGAGKFDDALKMIDDQLKSVKSEQIQMQLTAIKYSLKLSAGKLDDDVIAFYRGEMKKMKGDAYAIGRFGFSLYGQIQQGAKVGPLAEEAVAAIESEIEGAADELKPLLNNTVALLQDALGNIDEAIKAQKAAIESADERQKSRLKPFLDQLIEKKGE
ncbi:MAG: TlpA disulfide reductase family protein [Planctomycetota bacterium]